MKGFYNNIIFLNFAPIVIIHLLVLFSYLLIKNGYIMIFSFLFDVVILPAYLLYINDEYLKKNEFNRFSLNIVLIWVSVTIGILLQIISVLLLDRYAFSDPEESLIFLYYFGLRYFITLIVNVILIQKNPKIKIFKMD